MAYTLDLPPEDRARSPITGWTRAHWEAVADHLLDSLGPWWSPAQARIDLPGRASAAGPASDGLEAFARSFVLAAYRAADGSPAGQTRLARYREGLAVGTDPTAAEAWPTPQVARQSLVEAASLVTALAALGRPFWDDLDDRTRHHVAEWLQGGLQLPLRSLPTNNWLLYPVLIEAFLRSVGVAPVARPSDEALALIESFHVADGWYRDGPGDAFDHYGAWSIHHHLATWLRIQGSAADPDVVATLGARRRAFLDAYCDLFGTDGAPLHHGRSLPYRTATAGPFWLAALDGDSPLSAGATRRLASGVLRHFVDRGVGVDGPLSLGWYDECLALTQRWAGPGSPYLASLGFAGLLAPPDHALWTAPEEPLPLDVGDVSRTIAATGWVVSGTAADGIVRVANHGADHHPFPVERDDNPLYRKLIYSTATGPGLGLADTHDIDATVTVLGDDDALLLRSRWTTVASGDGWAISRTVAEARSPGSRAVLAATVARYEGALVRRVPPLRLLPRRRLLRRLLGPPAVPPSGYDQIETCSVLRGDVEVRVHHLSTLDLRSLRDGGAMVAASQEVATDHGPGWARVTSSNGLTSVAVALHGGRRSSAPGYDDANAFGPRAAAPVLVSAPIVAQGLVASAFVLRRGHCDPTELAASVAFRPVGRRAGVLEWADGERFLVCLGVPEALSHGLDGVPEDRPLRAARLRPGFPPQLWPA